MKVGYQVWPLPSLWMYVALGHNDAYLWTHKWNFEIHIILLWPIIIQDLGIKDGDVINLDATAAYSINQNRSVMAPNLRQAPSSASTSGGQTANMGGANLISALVNNIKVPTKRQISKPSAEGLEKIARSYFDALTEEHRLKSTVRLDYLRVEAEELAIAFEKNPSNFGLSIIYITLLLY